MRGDGHVYKRGNRWWVAYHKDGERFREPCGKDVTSKTDAKAMLKRIRGEIARGTYLAPAQRELTVDAVLDELVVYLKNRGAASVRKVESHLKAVRAVLGRVHAVDLNGPEIERYQRTRLEAGRAPATVNRECEALRQALRQAADARRIPAAPRVRLLRVQNARQGFLSRADFEALLGRLTDADVRDFVEWFWWTGMRPGEIRQLSWSMLDRETWTLNLDPKADKNRRGRVLAIAGPLRAIIDRRLAARRLDCALIFHRVSKGRPGQPVRDFRLQWRAALSAAGLAPGLLPYDLRRTALRNMVRGGTDYTVAMKISGHRTRSTFDRYNITSAEDVAAAITRTADYVATLPAVRNVAALPASVTPQLRHNRTAARKRR